jgi:hypothetical protein
MYYLGCFSGGIFICINSKKAHQSSFRRNFMQEQISNRVRRFGGPAPWSPFFKPNFFSNLKASKKYLIVDKCMHYDCTKFYFEILCIVSSAKITRNRIWEHEQYRFFFLPKFDQFVFFAEPTQQDILY